MTQNTGQGNPQGKGTVPVLEHWRGTRPTQVRVKRPGQILADYFTTLLVLSAEFPFKPIPGVNYHLYYRETTWQLSLIAPEEWRDRIPGPCLGSCLLLPDMTWRLTLSADAQDHSQMLDALEAFREGFLELLGQAETLEDTLPYFVAELPYYRRLLASGLAASLSGSLQLSSLAGQSGRLWLAAMEEAPLALTV